MIISLIRFNINDGVEKFRNETNAILLDVRRVDEYQTKHIPGSINIPVEVIEEAPLILLDKNQTIYVYCRSGVRSLKASEALINMGYTNIIEIGGILDYTGPTE